MVSATSLEVAFPLASCAPNLIGQVPTGMKDGALFVITGCGSAMSVAEAAERKEGIPGALLGIPVGVVA